MMLPAFFACFICIAATAQDKMPGKLLNTLTEGPAKLERLLDRQTEKYLDRLEKQEKKMQRKLRKKDSVAAKEIFGDVEERYTALKAQLTKDGARNLYSGHLDSMQTALRFLDQNKLITDKEKLNAVFAQYGSLQQKLNQTNNIRKLLKERQAQLKQQLVNTPLAKEFKKYQKELYYYRTQLDEYKRAWEDPSKLEQKLLETALKIPAFKNFFSKHSVLASLFRLPGSDEPSNGAIAGLQTRASVQQLMESRFGSGPDVSRAMQQNIQSAQTQLNQLKQKISSLGQNGADLDMPGFKPNSQRTRGFWRRIELGANMQSTRSNSFFPVTSDIGLSAGYKINDKSIAGIGASYKLGWGQNIRNIKLTHEGVGLRSFLDWKIKGSFYASGGFEYNYQQPFASVQSLYKADNWQESGLLGVSKIISVNSKFFKKTKLQLLWDFLSYDQLPRTQPLKFRVGYSF